MYETQVEIVKAAVEALKSEAPHLLAELEAEQKAAATGLEYYGITSSIFAQFLERNLVTENTRAKLKEGVGAVEFMFQS